MELVIEIDKKTFDYIMACSFVEDEAVMLNQSLEDRIKTLMFFDVLNAIKSGTPLPNGHGRLGDLDALEKEIINGIKAGNYEEGYEEYPHINSMDDCIEAIEYADIIIEADKED